ncbi:hypothetical protein [Alkalibaculum bacchi]|uniref:hypothetical protein n=1 Tax=Alkalibaculum bacchi TaxID=645887 RepID=UPI0026ECAB26|nr:hypothetical protein [Alkalibaculum bacchi]
MDYMLMLLQVISMVLTNLYLFYFLMSLLVKENPKSENYNKKYAWKLLSISIRACIIFILNLVLNIDFVSVGERKTAFNMFLISLAINLLVNKSVLKDATYKKLENYEKKIKVGIVTEFVALAIFLVSTILKLFYS